MAAASAVTGVGAALRVAGQATVLACVLALGTGGAWGVGFAAFGGAAGEGVGAPPDADGIVVLTGGADRVDTALRLLAEGRAPLLLVSGVGHGTELAGLTRAVPLGPDLDGRVTLGRAATSTVGNAAETAGWVAAHGVRRLIVVTAGYHMARAMLELGRAMPGVTLYPVAVRGPQAGQGWRAVRVLATEYDKFLVVWSRLAGGA